MVVSAQHITASDTPGPIIRYHLSNRPGSRVAGGFQRGMLMSGRATMKQQTLAVHAGTRRDPTSASPKVPVHRTSAFAFSRVQEMAETFSGKGDRYIYSRYGNPSLTEAEECLAALEGGEGGVVFSSGMAAITATLLAAAGSGEGIIAQTSLYGGTATLLRRLAGRMGIEVTMAGIDEVEELSSLIRPNTRAVFLETPTNPTLKLVDLEKVCSRGREAGLAVIVDNTFATPINQNPLSLGASVVVHSATKFLAGHGDLMAGAAVASGELLARIREVRKETGAILDPEAAWLLSRSLRTLPLRMKAHNDNAADVARYLEGHEQVAAVHYPGLAGHERHGLAMRQMRGMGGLLSFELKAGAEAARRFVEGLEWIVLLPTLGGVETSVVLPALSSHSGLTSRERKAEGISDGLVRLSVGVEAVEDILVELERGMMAAAG
jgi:cystathionine beta-lyase/cystathionine gamma-synthase